MSLLGLELPCCRFPSSSPHQIPDGGEVPGVAVVPHLHDLSFNLIKLLSEQVVIVVMSVGMLGRHVSISLFFNPDLVLPLFLLSNDILQPSINDAISLK